ncbi:MAG: gliding motility-associated C-terminal domain-containing protein, partial [Hymenobacteraceae bacterium]|nr:gliding motility-associated C-terminal domain-containing protein [Hymenobacteraceae bacterium]MDX5395628.1 gliding motility-associated C-terminal domain-containing protein [Hymenobacteraceae bacterium]MDX5443473.1 gliding motility-associated C-terminal domain-containing protein [Hymenobacteraceae bacterium]MDX5511682.1 gliding motility-associated C-terminal domain-containing protein [Hymenobacteraceae bacterium]
IGVLLLWWGCACGAFATHLVGGEMAMESKGSYIYEISLNLYFDVATGSTDAEDDNITIATFDKQTNKRINEFVLSKVKIEPLKYTNPACVRGNLQTKIIRYSTIKQLNPANYSKSTGYYMTWERCCRNNGITNIVAPQNQGMVFYLEFPAIETASGQPFVNNSPVLNPPSSDYLCRDEIYTYSFAATDADGDSLVYSLTTPLAGHTTPGSPFTQLFPGPYPETRWQSSYSEFEMIRGNPPLSINSRTGVITVRPSVTGLFVFAVTCEEYRNGVKIGEVRREMQLMVLNCPTNNAPAVSAVNPATNQPYIAGDTIVITDISNSCIPVSFRDPNTGQKLTLQAIPVNFTGPAPILSVTSAKAPAGGGDVVSELCWSDCGLASQQQIFKVNLQVSDDGCPQPKTAVLPLIFKLIPFANQKPAITTNLPGNAATITVGQTVTFSVFGSDADNDLLRLTATGAGFSLPEAGMQFVTSPQTGQVEGNFTWQPDCRDFERSTYNIVFRVKDNSCFVQNKDSVVVRLTVQQIDAKREEFLPPNLFTPNNDNLNDYFEMPSLPKDNCSDSFSKIRIYNRWGSLVYESQDRNFKWDGKNISDGVYFYQVFFRNSQYKGTVTVVR